MSSIMLEEEAAEVAVLMDKLKKMTELTDKISRSLGNLSGSAQLVEKSVQPILNQTGTLTVLAANMDSGIKEIDENMRLFDLVKQEGTTIRKGPQTSGVAEYLSSLKRLSEGLIKLRTYNMRSSHKAVKDMTALLKTGAIQLEELFRNTLAAESAPVEPLHYLTKQLQFPTFSREKITTLSTLNEFLSSNVAQSSFFQSSSITIYTDVRGPYIASSLSSLSQASINAASKRATSTYEKGENGIVYYSPAIEKIFEAEYDNISSLFSAELWTKIYSSTTQPAMLSFANTIRQLNQHVKANMMTDCFLAYDVIECVTDVAKRLGNKTGEKSDFAESSKPIRQTALSSFYELMEDTKRRGLNLAVLPPDLGVCDLTTVVMGRLRRMTDYQSAVSGLLITLGDKNWNNPFNPTVVKETMQGFDVGADGRVILCNYCTEMIERAFDLLESRAKVLVKRETSTAVFMINNVAYVESNIRRSELFAILNLGGGMAKVEKWRKKVVADYLRGWKECAQVLLDTTFISKTPSAPNAKLNLSSKEKDSVKEKLKKFNEMFDELVKAHKAYAFPDKEVKQMLYKEVCFLSPLYGRFYDKYHDVVKDKHIKYDKGSLEQVLLTLQ